MTLFRYALKNIKKESIVSTLTILQLAAVIVTAVIMVSSVLIRYQYYAPFSDVFNSNGIYCEFSMPANYDEEKMQDPLKYIADDEIMNFIPDVESVLSCNSGPCWFVDETGEPLEADFLPICYDNDMIERYKPTMAEGRWLNTSNETDCIECVISENSIGLKVGDRVKLAFFSLDEKDMYQDVLIVGMLSENAKIVGFEENEIQDGEINITSLYGGGNFNKEDKFAVLLSSDYLSENTTVLQGIFGPALITFPEDYPSEKIDEVRQQISSYNCNISYTLSDMKENSMSYIFEQIRNLLPIIIVLIVMTVVSSVSSSALSARRELKSFAILYITGLRWKQCALINMVQSLIMVTCSVVLSGICLLVLMFAELDIGIKIILQWETVMCVVAIVALFVLMSLIMPLAILSKTTPKQILTK